jgi:ribulose-phosphate 3-epimerase
MKIAPSILSSDFVRLEEEINKIEKNGADIIHLDVMDGHFVPNLTFGIPVIKQIRKITSLPLDVHLMVKNPDNYVNDLAQIGVEYVSVHQEASAHLHRLIMEIKSKKIKAGVALNPSTPVEMVFPIIKDLDFVLLMSVNPGFGGQSFLPLVYDKMKKLQKMITEKNLSLEIEIDGGVNSKNAPVLKKYGADILVAGSFVFGSDNYSQAIRSLK